MHESGDEEEQPNRGKQKELATVMLSAAEEVGAMLVASSSPTFIIAC
jgi:hypothetical protein